jgi:hypothetical protein
MLTRNATKELAKQTADAEARCDNLVAAVNAMTPATWDCLPAATQDRLMAAMNWDKLDVMHTVFQPHVSDTPTRAPSLAPTLIYEDQDDTPTRAPSLAPTLPCKNQDDTPARAPSLAPTIDYPESRAPSSTGTLICF